MPGNLLFVLTFVSALACGLMAGVFFAFSSFVMKGLARLPPAQGIAAMQAINVAALERVFMAAFFGSTVACVVLAVSALVSWHKPNSLYRLIGSGVYLLGVFVVTAAFNVPRNEALAAVQPDSADGAIRWAQFVAEWTTWNHVRVVAALVAAALLTLSLREHD
ncbi:DUF1772 domain-containing protein [Vitiosangium sp. GDMCC 1.1324]|uniref:anthrone oxygenase family protein n=1 Tax=Vitiosangium sp. (strain GDMCC 1.1324) TaxID=2138576 RepID=UPI000D3B09D3|nr:anthrone oxygenase family protein [Vitiosangium sp. GDMCC 1.1324]PTL83316.1 hypothetical protein DAT35_15125 [Vitiosangium sp. GDMCC 1.1324]